MLPALGDVNWRAQNLHQLICASAYFNPHIVTQINTKRFRHIFKSPETVEFSLESNDGSAVPITECANISNHSFAPVFTKEPLNNMPVPLSFTDCIQMSTLVVPEGGVRNLINNLKISTSAGDGGVSSKLLACTKTFPVSSYPARFF